MRHVPPFNTFIVYFAKISRELAFMFDFQPTLSIYSRACVFSMRKKKVQNQNAKKNFSIENFRVCFLQNGISLRQTCPSTAAHLWVVFG